MTLIKNGRLHPGTLRQAIEPGARVVSDTLAGLIDIFLQHNNNLLEIYEQDEERKTTGALDYMFPVSTIDLVAMSTVGHHELRRAIAVEFASKIHMADPHQVLAWLD